ncbi:TlpA disulfide reductase family protein [Pedobacter aquatilis]|uniref:TlpA family protein disulfide reductase n=1 Tax=Pedobacter aquatilis TaxID=351343 RepID=UPI00292E3645|nr:TlpA disulfide reductase family protein [Pedobacter aquatilis]
MIKTTLSIILILFALITSAQTSVPQQRPTLDEKSVVRGEDGLVYPYNVWRKLMQSGKYGVKSRQTKTDDGQQEWMIYELTAEQRKAMMDRMPKPRQSDSFIAGEKFNGFKTSDMNGNKFDLKNPTGKVIVLNFWFINCPPCKAEIPELNELTEAYKDQDVIFLAIALDEKYLLKDFLKTLPFKYNIVDNGRFIADKYKVKGYPTHVVIDKTGTIKFSTLGLASNTIGWIKKSIDESLATN